MININNYRWLSDSKKIIHVKNYKNEYTIAAKIIK